MLNAFPIECVGTAKQVISGGDTIFVFKDEIHLRSTTGDVDWYRADGSLVASNIRDLYPDEGVYKVGKHRFIAEKYKDLDSLSFTIEPSCTNTILHISGVDDFMSRKHTYTLYYDTLGWNTEEWELVTAIDTGTLSPTISLPPLYNATTVKLCYDCDIREALGLDSACVEVALQPDEVVAVNMELTSLATTRGQPGEKSNERNRPVSQELIAGSECSGALEVAFYSNPTPAALFYHWSIYHGADLIVTRHDEDIRYSFSEPGNYKVVCAVNNQYCASDSSEVSITISESYLAVPNVFTPNGDGINDEFRVAYRSLREFHCWVYNRWGKLVYQWTDPAKGWDGTINGRPAAEGAYFYVIRAVGTDAAKNAKFISTKTSYKKKKLNADPSVTGIYQLSGDINLLRGKK